MLRSTIIAAALLVAVPAHAQLCLGAPDFTVRPGQVTATIGRGDDITVVEGGISTRLGGGAFGGMSAGAAFYGEEIEATSFLGGVSLGYAVPLTSARKAFVCPFAAAAIEVGPNIGTVETQTVSAGPGLAVGGEVVLSSMLSFVPYTAGRFVYGRLRVTDRTGSATVSDTYGLLYIGGSLLIDRRLAIGPSIGIPLGVEDGKASFGFTMSLGLGGK